nr:hypothetical protein Iba_scaffold38878CG0010 [Ipomoea batatas]GMD26329.1 hypothetical protein Iba_chr08dCG3220 [Ipomoea batatas]
MSLSAWSLAKSVGSGTEFIMSSSPSSAKLPSSTALISSAFFCRVKAIISCLSSPADGSAMMLSPSLFSGGSSTLSPKPEGSPSISLSPKPEGSPSISMAEC